MSLLQDVLRTQTLDSLDKKLGFASRNHNHDREDDEDELFEVVEVVEVAVVVEGVADVAGAAGAELVLWTLGVAGAWLEAAVVTG